MNDNKGCFELYRIIIRWHHNLDNCVEEVIQVSILDEKIKKDVIKVFHFQKEEG